MKKQNAAILSFFLGILTLLSCNKVEPVDTPSNVEVTKTISFSVNSGISSLPNLDLSSVTGYFFKNNTLYKKGVIALNEDGTADIPMIDHSTVYFIAGLSVDVLTSVGETKLSDFLQLTVGGDVAHNNSAPLFVSGSYSFTQEGSVAANIPLKYGVSRIDISSSTDPLMKISNITASESSTHALAFADGAFNSPTKQVYQKEFTPAVNGSVSGLMYLYESSTPVIFDVDGTYNDVPVKLTVSLPAVVRNKIYSINILNAGAVVSGSFEVMPWEDGETVEGKPDINNQILLHKEYSNIPSDVKVSYPQNRIDIPSTGADMTIAFLSSAEVDVHVKGVTPDVTISKSGSATNVVDGVLTKYDVHVARQGNGRLPYNVTLELNNMLLEEVYDNLQINVAPADKQIETTTIGGVEWMAFNARSRNLEDQTYLLDGLNIEQVYQNAWLSTVGGLFQWGRQYMYTPWLSGYSNAGGQNQNAPWVTDTHVPCPDGYRVPSVAEIRALLPNGQVIPGTYAVNGETITASLHDNNTPVVTTPANVGGTQRYVKFTSESTGAYLILPLAGFKGDKSSTNNPGFGSRIIIWSNNSSGAISGWAWTGEINFGTNTATSATIANNSQLQAEGYAYLRCVKN